MVERGGNPERLVRVPEGRLLAGVCTGLGTFTGIDPVIFRIGFALLTLTGGGGVLLYIAAFLLMPADRASAAITDKWFGRAFDGDTVLAILCGLLGVGLLMNVGAGGLLRNGASGNVLTMLVILALGLLVAHARGADLGAVLRSMPERLRGRPVPTGHRHPGHPRPDQAAGPTVPGPAHGATAHGGAAHGPVSLDKTATEATGGRLPEGMIDLATFSGASSVTTPGAASARVSIPASTAGSGSGSAAGSGSGSGAAAAASQGRSRRSVLASVTLLLALIVSGVMIPVTLHASGSGPDHVKVILAAALMVVGAGLLIGSVFGRGRGLAMAGTLLSISLLATSVAGEAPVNGRYGDVEWRPGEIPATERSYRMVVGGGSLDLTSLPLRPGNRVKVNAEFLVGQLRVALPRSARVELHLKVGMGDITVDRHVTSGPGAEVEEVLQPDDGEPVTNPPVIELRVRGRLGDLEVKRA